MHQLMGQDVVDIARREENGAPVHVDAPPAGAPPISEVAHLHGWGRDADPHSKMLNAVLKPGATVLSIPPDEVLLATLALRAQEQEAPVLQAQRRFYRAGRVDELEPVGAAQIGEALARDELPGCQGPGEALPLRELGVDPEPLGAGDLPGRLGGAV